MKFFKQTAVVFIATALNFLFSYLLHFLLGRLLGPAEYGRYGVTLNISWIMGLPFAAVTTSLIKYSAELKAKNERGKLKSLLTGFLKFSLLLNTVFTLFYITFSVPLSNLLGGGISSLIIILALSFPLSGLSSILFNFLQGIGKVYHYSFINSISTLIRLLIATLLVLSGLGAFGALLSLIFSNVALIILCLLFVYPYFRTKTVRIHSLTLLKFGLPVLFVNIFTSLVLYFDLFFVSSFLGAAEAGYYNVAVTLSRAFLMSSSVLAVFFPEFSKDSALSDFKKLRSNIKWALFYTFIICALGLLVFNIFTEQIISLTYSSVYLPAVPLLRVLSIGYLFYSLFNVLMYALWALGKHKIAGIYGVLLFISDLLLLSIFVPLFGSIGAAWITTILLIILFIFSLLLIFKGILKR